MKGEVQNIINSLNDAYEGDPWFGRNAKALLRDVDENIAFEKPNGQHSILELVWHMITWREFVISRMKTDEAKDLTYFESNDWRELDHADISLWQKGVQRLETTQRELLQVLEEQTDEMLDQNVDERTYTFRKLLNGIIQHDIYHLGQIAYVTKLLK